MLLIPNSEGEIRYESYYETICCPDSFPWVDSSTIIACFPPDDIDYDYEFAI